MSLHNNEFKNLEKDLKGVIFSDANICNKKEQLIEKIKKSSIPETAKNTILKTIQNFESTLPEVNNVSVSSHAYALGIQKEETGNNETIRIKKHLLTPEDRKVFQSRGLPSIENEDKNILSLNGGPAREATRHITGLPKGPDFSSTINDHDNVIVQGNKHVLDTYPTLDKIGSSEIFDLSEESITKYMKTRDMRMNQCLLTKEYLYYTQGAIKDLRSGHTQLIPAGKTFYGISSYKKEGEDIFKPSVIMSRAMRFVIEGKIKGIEIPTHNLEKENLETLYRKSEPGVMARRRRENKDIEIKDKYIYMARYAHLLCSLDIIESPKVLLNMIEEKFADWKSRSKSSEKISEEEKDSRIKLSRYMVLELDEIFSNNGYNESELRMEKYDINNKEKINLSCPTNISIAPSFIRKINHLEDEYPQYMGGK